MLKVLGRIGSKIIFSAQRMGKVKYIFMVHLRGFSFLLHGEINGKRLNMTYYSKGGRFAPNGPSTTFPKFKNQVTGQR